MDERASGVILRVRLLTESSLIVQWLTAEHGRIATVARGARRAKSPHRGKLDLFHAASFTFRRSRRSDLHQLGEVSLGETHPMLRKDWKRLTQASYGVCLLEQATENEAPMPELWREFMGFLAFVNVQPPWVGAVLALELKVLEHTGLFPDLDRESLPQGARDLAMWLVETPWDAVGNCAVGKGPEWDALVRFLHGFLIFHLGRMPKGRNEALGLATSTAPAPEP